MLVETYWTLTRAKQTHINIQKEAGTHKLKPFKLHFWRICIPGGSDILKMPKLERRNKQMQNIPTRGIVSRTN
jgi:hypothetical protein